MATIQKTVVPAEVGSAEVAAGVVHVHDVELDGDEDLSIGQRVEIRDGGGRFWAATVTDRVGERWQLTIKP